MITLSVVEVTRVFFVPEELERRKLKWFSLYLLTAHVRPHVDLEQISFLLRGKMPCNKRNMWPHLQKRFAHDGPALSLEVGRIDIFS
jgi:hypothetical protein